MIFNLFRRFVLLIQRLLNNHFSRALERKLLSTYNQHCDSTPIFIIGAPRTGSTLLYQLIVKYFKVAYLSNLASLFFSAPISASTFSYKLQKNKSTKLDSQFGYIKGLSAPSEASKIINDWFGNDLCNDFVNTAEKNHVHHKLCALEKLYSGPIVIKNMKLCFKIEQLSEVFPNAIFLYIKRNRLYNAQSILLARKKIYGNFDKWWSFKVPGYEKLKKESCYIQVVQQIKIINQYIEELQQLKLKDRIFTIQYEELCNKPDQVLNNLSHFIQSKNIKIKNKLPLTDACPQVVNSNDQKLTDEQWNQLSEANEQIYN